MNRVPSLAVIGGGAAGLVAALTAARNASRSGQTIEIAVLERMQECGRKLRAAGNGRGNLGPAVPAHEAYLTGSDIVRLDALLKQCNQERVLALFRSAGLTISEQDGRLYPSSFQAAQIRDCLELACRAEGVRIHLSTNVEGLQRAGGRWKVIFREGEDRRQQYLQADKVILALGGSSQPALGGDGSWQDWLPGHGIGISPLRPGLQALEVIRPYRTLKGQRQQARAVLWEQARDGYRSVAEDTGEVQFTAEGLSGVVIMQLSLYLEGAAIRGGNMLRVPAGPKQPVPGLLTSELLRALYGSEAAGARNIITLDLLPHIHYRELLDLLQLRARELPWLQEEQQLLGLLPDKLAAVLSKMLTNAGRSKDKRQALLAKLIKAMPFPLAQEQVSRNAQVSLGGIRLEALNEGRFELHRLPGVYACGEMLDVTALCGGYNLAFAFASGMQAAEEALRGMN